MKIALFTTNRTTIPPSPHIIAASATMTGILADKLVERGHDVTLYAAKGSRSKARIIDLNLAPTELDYALKKEEWVKNLNLGMKQVYISAVYKDADKYDIIHLQTEPVYLGMHFAALTKTPSVFTNHNVFVKEEREILTHYHMPIITISNYQRTPLPDLNYIRTVYNGIDAERYPVGSGEGGYMLFLGRLVDVKGVRQAIEVAQATKRKLIIAGKGTEEYVRETITPHVGEYVEYRGHVERETREWYELYANARLFISPLQWEEPFGLVYIESMACGTPVVAFDRGAVPEIVHDQETGYVVNSSGGDRRGAFFVKHSGMEGIKEAVERIYSLPDEEYLSMRRKSRQLVLARFTLDAMVQGYEQAYSLLLNR